MHTMYIDKPMQGHGLMQAIARVNRVFRDKPGGLVVDYLGLADQLKQALHTYTESGGQGETALDQAEAVALMLERYEICLSLFHGFDWSLWTKGTPAQRLSLLPAAQEHVPAQEGGKERLLQAVTELSKAFALAVPHQEAIRIRDDVGFFQAVRTAIAKTVPIAILVFPACLFLLRRKGKSIGYLLCFCLFGIYLWGLASYTIFPFPLHFHPRGFRYAGLHLVPAILEGDDPNFRLQSDQVYGNFLAGVPFGFGLPFVVAPKHATPGRMLWLCLALGVAPELVQLLQNLLFDELMMRTVDIDDVWLCFLGAVAGYGVLRATAQVYRRIGWVRAARLPVWDHFHAVLLKVGSGPERSGHEEPQGAIHK